MTTREHLRKMSILGDQGAMEEKHLYRLASCMSAGELRQRQEMLMRNQMIAVNPQVMGSGPPQRMPAITSTFDGRFVDRDMLPSTEMISQNDARPMHMAPHLGASVPAHVNMLANRMYTGPGYGFLQQDSLDSLARRQELVQKQNIARMEMEMNAIYQQKEIEKAHRKGLLDIDNSFIYPGLQVNQVSFRGRHRLADGHLTNDMYVHQNALEDLHGGAVLVTHSPYPAIGSIQRERGRRQGRRAGNHKSMEGSTNASKSQAEEKSVELSSTSLTAEDEKADTRESDTDAFSKSGQSRMSADVSAAMDKECNKEFEPGRRKHCASHEISGEGNSCTNGNGKDLNKPCSMFDDKFSYPPPLPLSSGPYGFTTTSNNLLAPTSGAHSLYLNREDLSSVEDLRKWTVDDVHNFICSLPGCLDYAQIFKDHGIDGETLPLLTEEHLLDTMGLKLGPALKVRSQVSRRLGNVFYMMNLPLSLPISASSAKSVDQPSEAPSPLQGTDGTGMLGSPCPQDPEICKPSEVQAPHPKDTQGDMVPANADFQLNFLKS